MSSPGPSSQDTHVSGDTLDNELNPPGAGKSVAHTAVMNEMPTWPMETDVVLSHRNKMCLLNQQTLVRVVLKKAIDFVLTDLLFCNSFPNAVVAGTSARQAVTKAAFAHYPGAAAIHTRLLRDRLYMANMSIIVSIRNPETTLLTFSIAACSRSNPAKSYQGALQCSGGS